MLNTRYTWSLFMIVGLAFGCGEKDSGDSSSGTILNGTWKKTCGKTYDGSSEDDSTDESTTFEETVYEFDNNSFKLTFKTYTDSTCAANSLTNTQYLEGTYAIGDDATSPADAKNLNVTITKSILTLATDAEVAAYNSSKVCGLTTWEKDKEVDMNGKPCDNDEPLTLPLTNYDLVKVDGSTVMFGDMHEEADGTTEAKRPTELDTTNVYTKI